MMERNDLSREYANLINNYPWQWYATLTFVRLLSFIKAWKLFHRWLTAIRHSTGKRVTYLAVIERDTWRTNPHFHVLLAGVDGEKRDKWRKVWYWFGGWSRIQRYDVKGGAKYYLGEKLTGNAADIKFSRHLQIASHINADNTIEEWDF